MDDRTPQRISVALCTRNAGRFIREQLESILTQTRPVDEIVLSDDDSSDDTVADARQLLESSPAAFQVHENHPALGVTANFEQAIRETSGELLVLSDQDDVWHPDKIRRIAAAFAADPGALLIHTDARLVDADGAPLGATLFEHLEVSEAELRLEESGRGVEVLMRRNLVTGATVAFRRSLVESALPFPPSWVHDEWLAMVAALHGGLRVLREQTVDYRQHGGNEIGVVEPTLRYRIGRMLEPRGDRNEKLAAKFSDLAAWAADSGQPTEVVAELRAKAGFETARARLPSIRLARVPRVLALAARGLYRRFASQGMLDVARDLLQRA